MITTISDSAANTIAAMAGAGLTAVFSIGIGVFLLVLLTTKQLALASGSGFIMRLGSFATIGIVPLLISFGIIMAFNLYQIMT
jgi:cytochrome c biogenesis protein CcdA